MNTHTQDVVSRIEGSKAPAHSRTDGTVDVGRRGRATWLGSFVAAIGTVSLAASASAQTITVDTAADVVDFGGTQTVADLPGPDGKVSLAEAGLASDNTSGVQTIAFHVPTAEWTMQAFYPGRAVLTPFGGFRVFDTAILDATTQTAFTGDTNPNGGEVVISSGFYMLNNVGGVARGFANTQVGVVGGSGNVIQGNSDCGIEFSDSSSGLIGGTSPGQGNTGSGFIKLVSSSNNVVVGNTTQRVRVLGNGPFQPPTNNNRIGGPTLAERNYITGTGSVSSQFIPGGLAVEIFAADGTVIQNNWIGTTPDGLSQGHPYTTTGVQIWGDANHNTIVRDNLIAGIHALATPLFGPSYYVGTGIVVNGSGSGVTIVGNKIGVNANGQPVLGAVNGIVTVNDPSGPVTGVVIGGTGAGQGNEIAGHDRQGILLANTYTGVRVNGNSIHDDGGIGIDLVDAGFLQGVSPNDALDADTGANGLQNFPVVQSASVSGASITVAGTFDGAPSATFALDVFASPQCDASGYGEGQLYLGSTSVTTDAGGSATFSATFVATVPVGWFATATATHVASGSTSEFSACAAVTLGTAPAGTPFCFGDGTGVACPCGNSGAPGNGCAHSSSASGGNVATTGSASLSNDTLVLNSSGMPNGPALYFQGTTQLAGGVGTSFGDGLRCAGGTVIRLGTKTNVVGASHYPGAGDASVSAKGLVSISGTRTYQVWYRDSAPSFCTSATFNTSNGSSVTWTF